jgi:methyltransferase
VVSHALYACLIGLTALERLVELRLSNRNAAWSLQQGGREYGRGHYPFMVLLHTGFLIACVGEVWLLERSFSPILGFSMLALAVLCQAGRWWCIASLGPQWNTRIIIVPDLPPSRRGPYRLIPHPNYLVVALEGVALPLVHGAFLTALIFTFANAVLMSTRIRCENAALAQLTASGPETS